MTGDRTWPRPALWAVHLAVLISGAAGLAYEVVWSRMLVIPLGNSADATALVLASFMIGMAAGARAIGALADRVVAPLRLYLLAEVALAAYALAMPFLVPVLGAGALHGGWEAAPGAVIARLVLGALLVALPAFMMGASIPVLVRGLAAGRDDVRRRVGPIYGLNTAGGAAGAALAGFWAVPHLGLTSASFVAAGASLTAALTVALARRVAGDPAAPRVGRAPAADAALPPRRTALVALVAAGTGGFVMLGAEVLWARLLTFVFGHDTYAFAALLVIVLAGLGIGGLLHRALSRRPPALVAGLLLAAVGLTLLLAYWLATDLVVRAGRDPFGFAEASGLAASLWVELYRELAYTPLLVLLPAIAAGAALPAACALYAGDPASAGRRVGTALLVNGVAAAAGAIAASFALIPSLGIQATAALLGAAAIVAGGAVGLLGSPRRTRGVVGALAVPVVLGALALALLPPAQPRAMLLEAVGVGHQRILHYEEARTGTVSVTENAINGERQLFMNAVNEVTTRLVHDQSFKLLGHLGPLLHPHPQRGLMICFGAGISAGAALRHPLARLDVIELSGAMPRAARLFARENQGVLDDPLLALHIGDGRQFLARSDERYDVVLVDSTHPKAVDSWILYTAEFYRSIEAHLDEDGIAVQWVPLHGLSEQEFKIIVRTFQAVFPETTMWVNVGYETYGQAAYVKLVGTRQPLQIDYRELSLRLAEPRIHDDLEPYGMASAEEILDCFLAGPAAIRAWTAGLPIQTDDRPFLPYITEYSAGRRMAAPLLVAVRSPVTLVLGRMGRDEPAIRARLERAHEAQGFLLAGMLERARETWPAGQKIALFAERAAAGPDYYLALAERYRDDPRKLFEIGSYLGNLGRGADARAMFERAGALDPSSARIRINLGLQLLDLGAVDEAVALLARVVEDQPENALARYNLGVALLAAGDARAAAAELERAHAMVPELYGARLALADAYRRLGRLKQAEAVLRQLVEEAGWLAEAWDMLGLIAAARQDWETARQHHSRALVLDPYRAEAHYNIGIALQEEGRLKAAAEAYRTALRIEPRDAEALNNLALVYSAAGMFAEAVEQLTTALEIEPRYPEAAYNLGLAYRGLGRPRAAAEMFAVALELAPDLEPAREQLRQLGIDGAVIEAADAGPADADPADAGAGDGGPAGAGE